MSAGPMRDKKQMLHDNVVRLNLRHISMYSMPYVRRRVTHGTVSTLA